MSRINKTVCYDEFDSKNYIKCLRALNFNQNSEYKKNFNRKS